MATYSTRTLFVSCASVFGDGSVRTLYLLAYQSVHKSVFFYVGLVGLFGLVSESVLLGITGK